MRLLFLAGLVIGLPGLMLAGADEDWQRIEEMEKAPPGPMAGAGEARTFAIERLAQQERALRAFASAHPADQRAHDARLRLAHALSLRADITGDAGASAEAEGILAAMERAEAAPPARKADAAFARLVIDIRRAQSAGPVNRDELLAAAREFQARYARENRAGGLLVEIASLFDDSPKQKLEILRDAQRSATDQDLRLRIADDLKRVALIGQPIALKFTSVRGEEIDIAEFRGKVVLVFFFAGWSAPSLHELERVQQTAAKFSSARLQAIAVSLDRDRSSLDEVIRGHALRWPIAFDGKSWESPVVRSFGINALPTCFLLDRQGRLRVVNPGSTLESAIQSLIRER